MTILVLIPIRPGLPDVLRERARELRATLEGCEAHARLCSARGDGRPFSAHAAARNEMLARYLRLEHTHVLWIDADVVAYPPDLPARLLAIADSAIVAPFPFIEGSGRFYDTYGFVDAEGRRASPWGDYLRGGDLIPMQAVGTCYLAPAALYHDGARYEPTPGHTEHWSVCAAARDVGTPIWAARRITVEHARLPAYGEQWHTVEGVAHGA